MMSQFEPSDMAKHLKDMDRLKELAPLFPQLDVNCMLISFLLIRTSHELYHEVSPLLTENGLSPGKIRILISLMLLKKPLLPSEMAQSAGVTRSTMTGLINGLEKDGLIRRGSHEDRRMTAIHLTEEGEAVVKHILPQYGAQLAGIMNHLTADERDVLKQLLYKIRAGIESKQPE
ncbi:MarR family winged helix-turn-helix transcriptional regulator [Paenibacillus campi]|uniref:MarR family winged helix-turn-helix transcriptional regulator n=1 Tax=Paenibacillus campi TaxID=3106031 RepID=UPI002AFE097C|nr:MarR family transcriptional regulator [Paenibacillus sp. SGZ-1014]